MGTLTFTGMLQERQEFLRRRSYGACQEAETPAEPLLTASSWGFDQGSWNTHTAGERSRF